MTSPFISVLLQSMIAMVTMIAPATHEPVVVVTDWSVPDRGIESIGSVIRRWGMVQKSLMESHSSEKAPSLCFLQ